MGRRGRPTTFCELSSIYAGILVNEKVKKKKKKIKKRKKKKKKINLMKKKNKNN